MSDIFKRMKKFLSKVEKKVAIVVDEIPQQDDGVNIANSSSLFKLLMQISIYRNLKSYFYIILLFLSS